MTTLDLTSTIPSIEELEALWDQPAHQQDRPITVLLNVLGRNGITRTIELTYGCMFDVAIGTAVDCPPTPYNASWTVGMVTALEGSGWTGPVKYVEPVGTKTGGRK
ncbi:hypothetical protein GCM10009720_16390 [Yaniella flava]|uniref:Uncharacterized protein n=1 Tax=Yaniella flava TaxID=287930 RepID=A0ABN2UGA6_9MICC|nr:hypothetical protein [Micrococcaceae bacterium]